MAADKPIVAQDRRSMFPATLARMPNGSGDADAGASAIWPSVASLPFLQPRTEVGTDSRHDLASPGSGALMYEDFDQPSASPRPEPHPASFSLADIEIARSEGFQQGYDAASTKAAAANQVAIRDTLQALATQVTAARDQLEVSAERSAAAIAQLLLSSLRVLLPRLTERYGEAEIRSLVRAILPGLFKEPAATVRVNPRHCDAVRREIAQYDHRLAERIDIVPADTIGWCDVRIEWRQGVAERDTTALWSQIARILNLNDVVPEFTPTESEPENAG